MAVLVKDAPAVHESSTRIMILRYTLYFSLSFSIVLLAGCDTVYQPLGWDGGYEDKPLSTNRHWIKYQGNSTTPHEWVLQSWHKRAKQLCANGYQTIAVKSIKASAKHSKIIDLPLQRQNPIVEGLILCQGIK